MRWVIDVECSPDADQLELVVATVENAVDFLGEALGDLELEAGVEARLAS